MTAHVIEIRPGASKVWKNTFSGKWSRSVRWACSCGRVGPEHLTQSDEQRAHRRARNGGTRHIAAMERAK